MKLKNVSKAIVARLESARARAVTASMTRSDPDLCRYESTEALLWALRACSDEEAETRSQIVRALLRQFQRRGAREAGEILVLSYMPMLRLMAHDLRKSRRGVTSDEMGEVVLWAFLEAASRIPTDNSDAPIRVNLALKTRQLAIRHAAERTRQVPTCTLREGDIVTYQSPERVLCLREGARAIHECEELASRLVAFEGDEQAGRGERMLSTSAALRRRFPGLSEAEFKRLYQRVRKETTRLASKIQRRSEETLSQLRDYLDLTMQENSNAWI